MFSALPSPSFPIVSTHSSFPRSPASLLAAHPLNHALRIAVPGASEAVARRLEKELRGTELFFYLVKCPLGRLLERGFVERHVPAGDGEGNLLLVSHRTPLDSADALCLAGGVLTMCLTKDTYESMGLAGKRDGKDGHRWIVACDFGGEYRPGSRMWDRLRWCLDNTFAGEMELLVGFTDGARSLEITFPPGLQPAKYPLTPSSQHIPGILVPPFPSPVPPDGHPALEWLGMLFSAPGALDAYEREDPYVSVYRVEEGTVGEAWRGGWRGLFGADAAVRVLEALRKVLEDHPEVPWAALSVHGFRDSPVAFAGKGGGARCEAGGSFVAVIVSREGWVAYEMGRQRM
ncbi:ribonuclease P 40kDa subunit-domain-containing protein [Hyaloraphidium curvatum]|nr:ribonuclease P 40kDa subunit-domain-containing protein [Hyaloraphidium curvatum]